MTYPHHEANAQHSETRSAAIEDPAMVALLGSAGLTPVDMQFFNSLRVQNQSVFVHGSIMAGRITPKSDIDFTIVGSLDDLAPDLKDTLMPGLTAVRGKTDYISTSIQSQDGRKVSMHLSEPEFRDSYPDADMPFATEFRPARHAKSGARKYFLSGTDRDGGVHLINFLCQSDSMGDDGSTLTAVPQTGKLTLKEKSIIVNGKVMPNIVADEVITILPDDTVDFKPPLDAVDIAILGLEFDKMLSDKSLYPDSEGYTRFVEDPRKRSMDVIGDFTNLSPAAVSNRMFGQLAKYWPRVKPNKSR